MEPVISAFADERETAQILSDALSVLVLDPKVRRFLQDNDPEALDQAHRALATYAEHVPGLADALAKCYGFFDERCGEKT